MWISPKRLAAKGILGINCRNRSYIGRYNDRRYYPLVDNKLKTKELAAEYQLSTPALLYVLRGQHQVRAIAQRLAQRDAFVIKPAKGSGGKGILVIVGRNGDNYVKASGVELTPDDITRHMSNVLAGLYSLGGLPDTILIEELVVCDSQLARYSHEGVPDIRIIVFQGYPVMAMLRLATHASDGKANLHQGAVGVGLDIATGRCLNAVQFSRSIRHHPDNGRDLREIHMPDWPYMLSLAAGAFEMTGLGYLGVDLIVDEHKGAQLLELNARPGLAIQISNGIGLLPRLRQVEGLKRHHASVTARVAWSQQQFAALGATAGAPSNTTDNAHSGSQPLPNPLA